MWHLRLCRLGVAIGLGALALGCSGTAKSVEGPSNGKGSGEVDITKAALPFKILRARGGAEISAEQFWSELAKSPAICIGESHKNPHHHWAQMHLFDTLSQRNTGAGIQTALGMEMFQRPFQGVLDDYAAGRITEKEMLTRSGYQQRWGYDWGFYAPTVKLAVARSAAILALNTARELTKRVSRSGLSKLTEAERTRLPELDLDDAEHRAWWDAIMGDMGGAHGHSSGAVKNPHEEKPAGENPHEEKPAGDNPHETKPEGDNPHGETPEGKGPHGDKGNPHGDAKKNPHGEITAAKAETPGERIYAAQVLWDETMAEGAANWLGKSPKRQIVILAGNGHCHDSAIVGRLKRRGVTGALSVRPVLETGQGEVAEALASPMNDFLLVLQIPE